MNRSNVRETFLVESCRPTVTRGWEQGREPIKRVIVAGRAGEGGIVVAHLAARAELWVSSAMRPTFHPDPFVDDPFDAPEAERTQTSIAALTLLIDEVRAGRLSEDVFFARAKSGFSDLKPQTGRHWLWRVHHRHHEVWKCLGRPNWSVRAYASWRDRFYATDPTRRLDRNGHPRKETFPKKEAGSSGLRHEHVVPMGRMLQALLDGHVTPEVAIALNVDAIITIGEDRLLDRSGHPDLHDPWRRYADTGIRFLPNPIWPAAHRAGLAAHGLVATPEEIGSALAPHPKAA